MRFSRLIAVALGVTAGASLGLAANPPGFDPHSEAGAAGAFGLGADQDRDPRATVTPAPSIANPLWGIPLSTLNETRQRPIFLRTRRAPAPAVIAVPLAEPARVVAPPPMLAEPARPPLNLVGIVVGTTDGVAVFINTATRSIVTLRMGEGHEGWVLTSVKGREAVLEKNQSSTVLALPVPAEGLR